MDDTSWLARLQTDLEQMLGIADKFYDLNNIQVNKLMSVLFTSEDTYDVDHNIYKVKLKFEKKLVRLLLQRKMNQYVFLVYGLIYPLNGNIFFHNIKILLNIKSACNIMHFKKLTDKQLVYLFNTVIVPCVKYCLQLITISHDVCEKLMNIFRSFFKKKVHLVKSLPSSILHMK